MALQPSRPIADEQDESGIIEPLCAVFRRSLKDAGLKYTPERAQILDTIIAFDALFEADQLLEQLKGKGFRVSKATVYRTLKLLEDAGIIQRVLFDRDQSHYQLAYGHTGNTLLVRVDTGEVETLELPELVVIRDKICKARGLNPEGHRLQIFATGDEQPSVSS
ncbi:MAG: transcriptional repressor [Planctomycetota bacterium]